MPRLFTRAHILSKEIGISHVYRLIYANSNSLDKLYYSLLTWTSMRSKKGRLLKGPVFVISCDIPLKVRSPCLQWYPL